MTPPPPKTTRLSIAKYLQPHQSVFLPPSTHIFSGAEVAYRIKVTSNDDLEEGFIEDGGGGAVGGIGGGLAGHGFSSSSSDDSSDEGSDHEDDEGKEASGCVVEGKAEEDKEKAEEGTVTASAPRKETETVPAKSAVTGSETVADSTESTSRKHNYEADEGK